MWVSPISIDFGEIGIGVTSPAQTITITNQGVLTLTAFAGGAPFDNQFGVVQNCAGGVAPGASCQYTFSFTPTSAGFHDSQSASSTNGGSFVIDLQGGSLGP